MTTYTSDSTWVDIALDGDPQLILGRRRGDREIEAVVVEVHRDLFAELRKPCEALRQKIKQTSARPYEAHAAIEADEEHFFLNLEDLPEQPEPVRPRRASSEGDGENPDRTAALVRALRSPGRLSQINATDLRGFKAIFYSIAFQQSDGSWFNFIKKTNPRQLLKPGRLWLHYGAPLRKVEDPDLVIESDVDVILGPTRLASSKGDVIKNLFTDVHLALRDADTYVDGVRTALGDEMPISEDSLRILRAEARKKFSIARRLYFLQKTLIDADIKPDQVRSALSKHNIEHSELLDENDRFSFGEKAVGQFLDVLEERYFESDWTNEPRRADKFSRRS